MGELKARHVVDVYDNYAEHPCEDYSQVYLKSEVDKFISDLEESHEKKVGQLLMKIAGLEKLVETANKILKPKGGFTVKDITFKGVKLEGFKKEVTNAVDKSNV